MLVTGQGVYVDTQQNIFNCAQLLAEYFASHVSLWHDSKFLLLIGIGSNFLRRCIFPSLMMCWILVNILPVWAVWFHKKTLLLWDAETETLIVSLTMSVVKHLILRLCIFVSSHRSRVPGKRGFNLTFILIWIYYSVLRQNAAGHVSGVWYCSWLTPMLLNISGVSLLDHTQFSPIRLDILLFNLI